MPCWQRVGITDKPCCAGCPPLPAVERPKLSEAAALDAIFHIMNGEHWDADTMADIAKVMTDYGYVIADAE
jgi:hypothetical protein